MTTTKTPTKRPTREEDHARALSVLRTILNAQVKGTLSPEMYVRRLPTQIVLENTTEADREWLTKKYPGVTQSKGWLHRDRRSNKASKTLEEAIFVAPLRKQVDQHDRFVPKLEIWGVTVPHEHHSHKGTMVNGKAVWRCGVCSKVVKP